jgi:hypothetical protein
MVKYIALAAALKLFSGSPQMRWLYRQLGNTLGQRMRVRRGLDSRRLNRAKKILELCERHHVIQRSDSLLEIGTGWIHWESTIIRLFYDVEITLFDVWDNRQLGAYKRCFGQFEEVIDKELDLDAARSERAHRLLQIIAKSNSFDEIYSALGFRYVINPSGTLKQFRDGAFSVIFSYNVLEHINRVILPGFIQDFQRLLKPSGHSIQVIDLGDHLAYYDRSVSLKNYLRYSDRAWRRFFQNDVQYFNRVQRPEWLNLFRNTGLELEEEETQSVDTDSIRIDKNYENLNRKDLQCLVLTTIHKKPETAAAAKNR